MRTQKRGMLWYLCCSKLPAQVGNKYSGLTLHVMVVMNHDLIEIFERNVFRAVLGALLSIEPASIIIARNISSIVRKFCKKTRLFFFSYESTNESTLLLYHRRGSHKYVPTSLLISTNYCGSKTGVRLAFGCFSFISRR